MGNNLSQNKPSNPAPPLNAKKSPKIKTDDDKPKPVRRSVYDEIAERRRLEKRGIGVTARESAPPDTLEQNGEDDDVKLYEPAHAQEHDSFDDEDNYDVLPPLPKPKKSIGLWVALISALSVLCLIAAGAYGLVNGYFDGIIKML